MLTLSRDTGTRARVMSDDVRLSLAADSRVGEERRIVGAPVQRVRKAYEQVHEQLRDLIMKGDLARGQRLPNEATLAREFGVSRGTVREALRVLAAENLIRTRRAPAGAAS